MVVPDAGVLETFAPCALRLPGLASGVLAWMKISSCRESWVGNRTTVYVLGSVVLSLSFAEASACSDSKEGVPFSPGFFCVGNGTYGDGVTHWE